jgi:hypothetical protein
MSGVICDSCQQGYDPALGPCPRCDTTSGLLKAAAPAEDLLDVPKFLRRNPDDDLPPCPVCGNDGVPCDVYNQTDGDSGEEREVAECNVCHSIVPTDALFRWDEQRRQPVYARLKRAAELLESSAAPYDEACTILRELLAR